MLTIDTLFIDASTHKTIGQAAMPVERLPKSFAVETTFHIADEDWRVIKADPMTAEEFIRTSKLVILLEKIVKIPAIDILYTLPSICDEIPAILIGSTKLGKDVLELREDDWRQIEFVSRSYRSTIDSQFAGIMDIYREASVNNGHFLAFKKIYVRQQINIPLQETITLDQLYAFFTPFPHIYDGISYWRVEGLIKGGFAFRIATTLLYGEHTEGIVKVLGVTGAGKVTGESKDIVHSFQKFMATYNLYLVDWCKPQLVSANTEMIYDFLVD